jgi:hypothetical protein
MTAGTPVWEPLTFFYDSAGQESSMVTTVADDGSSVKFLLDRLTISLNSNDAPFSGAVGLSGALSVTLPEELNLLGFLLAVNGHIDRTEGSQAVVTCSVGHGTQSVQWPLVSVAGTPTPTMPRSRSADAEESRILSSEFRIECFTSDFNPSAVGVPPFAALPPFPITVSLQTRRRAADEAIDIAVTDISVILVTSS